MFTKLIITFFDIKYLFLNILTLKKIHKRIDYYLFSIIEKIYYIVKKTR